MTPVTLYNESAPFCQETRRSQTLTFLSSQNPTQANKRSPIKSRLLKKRSRLSSEASNDYSIEEGQENLGVLHAKEPLVSMPKSPKLRPQNLPSNKRVLTQITSLTNLAATAPFTLPPATQRRGHCFSGQQDVSEGFGLTIQAKKSQSYTEPAENLIEDSIYQQNRRVGYNYEVNQAHSPEFNRIPSPSLKPIISWEQVLSSLCPSGPCSSSLYEIETAHSSTTSTSPECLTERSTSIRSDSPQTNFNSCDQIKNFLFGVVSTPAETNPDLAKPHFQLTPRQPSWNVLGGSSLMEQLAKPQNGSPQTLQPYKTDKLVKSTQQLALF
ncbi:hypothetical protein FGO68_gene15064 [Halteria grandinella]|uniref:Uncharacterized protein n=1 Tax=Halteria grandinella TaxID=5974 RepID=A0A8J8T3P8_HALGN|nr:hypothetical protein FGO68_gene15064 [Halteria grandinella]